MLCITRYRSSNVKKENKLNKIILDFSRETDYHKHVETPQYETTPDYYRLNYKKSSIVNISDIMKPSMT